MISSQETYLLRLISCVEHVVASQKQIADLKGPSLLKKLEKIRKWKKSKKKTTISVTVTYLLNAKTSRSKLSSITELTWVQAQCQRYIPGSFVGKQGDLRGELEIGESTHADFFCAVHLTFFWFILSCFLQFLSFCCPNNFIYVFSLRWWISNYYL